MGWEIRIDPEIYRPASSALGMCQLTDGTFAEARKYCIHEHEVVEDGPWYDIESCWFNVFYTRIIASHAIELTAAYLHLNVVDALNGRPIAQIRLAHKERLAAVIHLCGASKGRAFADTGFQPAKGDTCGTQSLSHYLTKVDRMRELFGRLHKFNVIWLLPSLNQAQYIVGMIVRGRIIRLTLNQARFE